jgi:hypothetical protein
LAVREHLRHETLLADQLEFALGLEVRDVGGQFAPQVLKVLGGQVFVDFEEAHDDLVAIKLHMIYGWGEGR